MSGPKAALENDFYGCGPAVALQDAGFSRGGCVGLNSLQSEGKSMLENEPSRVKDFLFCFLLIVLYFLY